MVVSVVLSLSEFGAVGGSISPLLLFVSFAAVFFVTCLFAESVAVLKYVLLFCLPLMFPVLFVLFLFFTFLLLILSCTCLLSSYFRLQFFLPVMLLWSVGLFFDLSFMFILLVGWLSVAAVLLFILSCTVFLSLSVLLSFMLSAAHVLLLIDGDPVCFSVLLVLIYAGFFGAELDAFLLRSALDGTQ